VDFVMPVFLLFSPARRTRDTANPRSLSAELTAGGLERVLRHLERATRGVNRAVRSSSIARRRRGGRRREVKRLVDRRQNGAWCSGHRRPSIVCISPGFRPNIRQMCPTFLPSAARA
jgi:hypothetical protein